MLGASETEQTGFLAGAAESVVSPTTTGGKKRRQKATEAAETTNADGGDKPVVKKSRTNTPWTPEEEHRLKQLRDLGTSWSEIAKTFPNRTEGSVKKHWYKVSSTQGAMARTFAERMLGHALCRVREGRSMALSEPRFDRAPENLSD